MENNSISVAPAPKKTHSFKEFFTATSNGMATGLFVTLIAGTIISTLALIFGNSEIGWIVAIYNALMGLSQALKFAMGVGIGLGIAHALKLDGLKLVSCSISGLIASYMSKGSDGFAWTYDFGIKIDDTSTKIGDPLTIYFVVVLTLLLVKLIFKKKTPVDIVLIPLTTALIALIITFVINQPVYYVTTLIRQMFTILSNLPNLALAMLAGLVISVVVGICLTVPMVSSAAIAVIFKINNVAGAAALVGCCCQMVGFAVQSYRDNGFLKSLSVGIGTSMIQFKNIIKKPVIWLPTIIASAILGPFVVLLNYQVFETGAGMGTCAFVGQITSIATMNSIGEPWWQTAIFIGAFQIILPFVLVLLLDFAFRKANIIKKGDLTL